MSLVVFDGSVENTNSEKTSEAINPSNRILCLRVVSVLQETYNSGESENRRTGRFTNQETFSINSIPRGPSSSLSRDPWQINHVLNSFTSCDPFVIEKSFLLLYQRDGEKSCRLGRRWRHWPTLEFTTEAVSTSVGIVLLRYRWNSWCRSGSFTHPHGI